MNAVEIEEAVSELAAAPFDAAEFPYAFLAAFGNKKTTIDRLRGGATNGSDVPGGVLQRNNIHIAVCDKGKVRETLIALRTSPKTEKGKVKFLVATDGEDFEADDIASGEGIACAYSDFAKHLGLFLPLAGISTVRQVANNPIDIKATGRLNKLYLELIKENPDWESEARRHDLNQFMARLIFCFFAEDTGIFFGSSLFTQTLQQFTDNQSSNTHEIIAELFRAMDTKLEDRVAGNFRPWADAFPYVNGGLFAGTTECPRFSRIARSYLLRAGELDWQHINPDIFGSMIQGIADDEERGSLGMHYTSVPNILKVLDPLFLDDLREQLTAAEGNVRKLMNLRRRIASIRVFDPACGSGNFLVIAYIRMREIEFEIVKKLRAIYESEAKKKDDPNTWMKLENFYGIDIKDFACETARLSLLIAEFQCDARLIGQREACLNILPLKKTGQIHCGNALRLDWAQVCPPVERPIPVEYDPSSPDGVRTVEDFPDSLMPPDVETYICGNPPYLGSKWLVEEQKSDLGTVFGDRIKNWKSLDYVAGWIMKAADFGRTNRSVAAFVSTNSICQGQQVPILWPLLFRLGQQIAFAHTSFKWSNLASHNAGVTVVIVGIGADARKPRRLMSEDESGGVFVRETENINAYLVSGRNIEVESAAHPRGDLSKMQFGNHPYYGGDLIMTTAEADAIVRAAPEAKRFLRPLYGSQELISAAPRACLWISAEDVHAAEAIDPIAIRLAAVAAKRKAATQDKSAQTLAQKPYSFREQVTAERHTLVIPRVSSESRPYLPVGLLEADCIVQDQAFAMYDAPIWNIALIASRLHLIWVATVCGKLETRYRYSNTLGWNTFPVPRLTDANKSDLSRCAQEILLAREAHFPATIADLYDPASMPENLRRAHDYNDETLERIYIGRKFRNDTERLEKLFELYTKMTKAETGKKPAKGAA